MKAVPLFLAALFCLMVCACSSGGVDNTCECTAGDTYCNGNILMVCPASCVAYTMIDCTRGGDGYVCSQGACVPGSVDGDAEDNTEDEEQEEESPEQDADNVETSDLDGVDEDTADPEFAEEDGDMTDTGDTIEEPEGSEEELAETDGDEGTEEADEPSEVDVEPETFDTTLLGSYSVHSVLSISTGMSNFNERLLLFDRFFSNDICSLVFETLAYEPGQEQYYALQVDDNGAYTDLGQHSCQTIYAGLVALSAQGYAESPISALHQILGALHMEGSYTFTAEPGAVFNDQAAQFSYDTFYVQWNRGCAEGDSACMRRDLARQDIAISQVGGPVSGSRDAVSISFDHHGLSILFSMLARTIINSIILPELYPSDGAWTYLSLISQVFGGQGCATTADCCSAYADAIVTGSQPTLWNDTKDACEVLSARLANSMNATLDAQDVSITGEFGLQPLQLFSEGACLMEDSDDNGTIDRFGHQEAGQRCMWRAEYYLSNGQEHVSGTWYGERQ